MKHYKLVMATLLLGSVTHSYAVTPSNTQTPKETSSTENAQATLNAFREKHARINPTLVRANHLAESVSRAEEALNIKKKKLGTGTKITSIPEKTPFKVETLTGDQQLEAQRNKEAYERFINNSTPTDDDANLLNNTHINKKQKTGKADEIIFPVAKPAVSTTKAVKAPVVAISRDFTPSIPVNETKKTIVLDEKKPINISTSYEEIALLDVLDETCSTLLKTNALKQFKKGYTLFVQDNLPDTPNPTAKIKSLHSNADYLDALSQARKDSARFTQEQNYDLCLDIGIYPAKSESDQVLTTPKIEKEKKMLASTAKKLETTPVSINTNTKPKNVKVNTISDTNKNELNENYNLASSVIAAHTVAKNAVKQNANTATVNSPKPINNDIKTNIKTKTKAIDVKTQTTSTELAVVNTTKKAELVVNSASKVNAKPTPEETKKKIEKTTPVLTEAKTATSTKLTTATTPTTPMTPTKLPTTATSTKPTELKKTNLSNEMKNTEIKAKANTAETKAKLAETKAKKAEAEFNEAQAKLLKAKEKTKEIKPTQNIEKSMKEKTTSNPKKVTKEADKPIKEGMVK